MGTVSNIKLGVCTVTFGGTDLGHTNGGVVMTYTPEYVDIVADQYGTTEVDKALVGEDMIVTVPFTEFQVSKLANVIPMGTLAGASDGRITIGKDAGDRLLDEAKELVLHPIYNTGDLSNDVVLYKAVAHGEVSLNFGNDGQTVYEVEFIALPDTSKSTGNYLGIIGDSTD